MASQGPFGTGTNISDSSLGGAVAWQSNSQLASENGSGNDVGSGLSAGTTTTEMCKMTNPGFSIPTGATIDGILVEIKRANNNASSVVKDWKVRIVKGGTFGTTDKADTSTTWPNFGAFAYKSYGGSSDLWGEAWTYSDINSSTFGCGLAAQFISGTLGTPSIDYCRITVYYTVASVSTSVTKQVMYYRRKRK